LVSKIFVTLTRLAQQQQLQKVLSFLSQNESRHSTNCTICFNLDLKLDNIIRHGPK
jgi:hypothetical protein